MEDPLLVGLFERWPPAINKIVHDRINDYWKQVKVMHLPSSIYDKLMV